MRARWPAGVVIDCFFINMGPWMENVYGLDVVQVALSTFAIGGAEVLSELGCAVLIDRVGPVRIMRIVAVALSLVSTWHLTTSTLPTTHTPPTSASSFATSTMSTSVVLHSLALWPSLPHLQQRFAG